MWYHTTPCARSVLPINAEVHIGTARMKHLSKRLVKKTRLQAVLF